MAFDFSQWVPATPQPQDNGGQGGGVPAGGFVPYGNQQFSGGPAYQQMMSYMPQVQQANQAYQINMQDPYQQQQYGGNQYAQWGQQNNVYARNNQDEDRRFRMNGGTEGLYNGRYRDANFFDTLAIEAGKAGEWWMNLPGQIAGAIGGEQAKEDWTFDASKFDLTNGLDMGDLNQLKNFAFSLPGMIPGGLLEGAERGYEAATGAPVREYREKQGGGYEVADYQLDASQRAAAAIDSAIDVGGTFLGASGKLLSLGGRAIGKHAEKSAMKAVQAAAAGDKTKVIKNVEDAKRYEERAKRLAEFNKDIGKGAFNRAGMGKGAQLAWNVGEEAGEEFVQSYADDVRMKNLDEGSLDRALTGAAWGALGGGLMHGTAFLADKAFGGGGKETADPSQNSAPAQDTAFEMYKNRNMVDSQADYRMTAAAESRANERLREPHELAASTSQFGTVFDKNLGLNDCRFTDGALVAMAQADDNGESVRYLAERLNTTEDKIYEICENQDEAARVIEWNNLIRAANAAGKKVLMTAGRNPDTNPLGVADVRVIEIKPGQGVEMHPWLYKALGGDIDGDKYQSYWSISHGQFGYYTRRLVDWVTGKANIDEDYVSFLDRPDLVKKFMKEINSLPVNFSSKQKTYYRTQFYKITTKKDVDALGRLLDTLRADIQKLTKDQEGMEDFADDAIGGIVGSLDFAATRTENIFDKVVKHLSDEEKALVEEFTKLVPDSDKYLRSGDNLNRTHFADFAGMFGAKIGINVGFEVGNPIMRQSGAYRYESKKDEMVFFNDVDMSDTAQVDNRFDNLVAMAFMLEHIGGEVENSIEGVWRAAVQERVLAEFGGKIDINGNFNDFIDIAVRVRNEMVDPFNAALERQTTDYGKSISVGAKKTPIDTSSIAAKAKMFNEIFGDYYIEELLDIDANNINAGKTFNQVIEEYATAPGKDFGPFSSFKGFHEFFGHMCNAYGINQRNVGSRVDNLISDIASKLRQLGVTDIDELIEITEDENGKKRVRFLVDDEETLFWITDAVNFIFGEDLSLDLRIYTVQQFLATNWGKEWMSGNESRMHNAMLSARLSHRYRDAIDLQIQAEGDWKADVQRELARIAESGGALDAAIYHAFVINGDLRFLRMLTDLDVSWEDKVEYWDKITVNDGAVGSLTSEIFVTANKKLGTSELTKKLTKAERSMTSAERSSNYVIRQSLESLRNSKVDDSKKLDAIKHFARTGYSKMSTRAVAAFIHSQRDVVKGMVDKGVAPNTSDIIFQMSERIKNGDIFSYLDQLSFEFGVMEIGKLQVNRVQLLSVLFDPTAEIRVYSPSRNGYLKISQKAIFQEVLGDDFSGDPNTNWDCWDKLMDACPAIATLLVPSKAVVTTEEGVQSVKEGSTGTIDAAIIGYANGLKDTTSQFGIDELRAEASQYLFADPNWWGVFLASIDGLDKSASLGSTQRLVNAALDKHIDWVLKYASLDQGGEVFAQRAFLWDQSGLEASLRIIEDLVDESMILDILRRHTGALYEDATDSITQKAIQFHFAKWLEDELEDIGIELSSATTEFDIFKDIRERADTSRKSIIDEFDNMSQDVKRALVVALNMMDLSSVRVGSYLGNLEFNTQINEYLDKIEAKYQSKPNKLKKIKKLRDNISNIQKDDVKAFLTILGLDDVLDTTNSFPEVIPATAVDDWNSDQMFSAVKKICEKYNINEDLGKAEKQIKKAFDENDRDAKVDIKNYFNQAILTYSTNNLVASGVVYNPLATKQTLEAYRTMARVGDKIHSKMKDRLERYEGDLPEMYFHYDNPVTSYMAASCAMNAASGSITSGISMDGAMMKMIAGFGLVNNFECGGEQTLISKDEFNIKEYGGKTIVIQVEQRDKDGNVTTRPSERVVDVRLIEELKKGVYGDGPFALKHPSDCLCGCCNTHTPASYSRSFSRGNYVAHGLSLLASWMQEARHLKAKKALGVFKAFDDPLSVNKDLSSSYSAEEMKNEYKSEHEQRLPANSRELILFALKKKRGVCQDFWHATFSNADGLDLPVEMEYALSNVTTPLIEVVVRDDNGDTRIEYVSSAFLANDAVFDAHYALDDDVNTPLLLNNMDRIVSINPVVMSLQEVAGKIVRETCNEFYAATADKTAKVSASDVHTWAGRAMKDWDSYNSKPLSMKDFLSGIASRGVAYDAPVMGDMNPSSRMIFDDELYENLRYTFTPRRPQNTKDMSESVWGDVERINQNIINAVDKDDNDSSFFDEHRIVYATGDNRYLSTGSNINFEFTKHDRDEYGDYDTRQTRTGNVYELVEMYVGNKPVDADAAYRKASSIGRSLLVPESVFNKMKSIDELTRQNVYCGTEGFTLEGVNYIKIDPSFAQYASAYRRHNMTIPVTALDPDEIQCAVGLRRFNHADAEHLSRKGFQAARAFRGRTRVNVGDILYGTNPVSLVTDPTEIANIKADQIDYSYYKNNIKDRSVNDTEHSSYRFAAEQFIKNMSGDKDKNPTRLRNVGQGDCVGFVKHIVAGGRVEYAPLYYEGSVAHTADVVTVSTGSRGEIHIDFATSKVDYSGNESMKLDLYGIAYKSMGHEATAEQMKKWAALDDSGFDILLMPDHVFDARSLASRVVELGDTILHRNLYFFTRKAGINLFYKRDGKEWKLRDDLSDRVKNNPSILIDLCDGSPTYWNMVGDGSLALFQDEHLNEIVARLTREILLVGGYPHLFFNSANIKVNKDSHIGTFVGLERRFMDPRVFLKNFNTDDTLYLFNAIDNRLCPKRLNDKTDIDGDIKVFDRRGRMLDRNTVTGKPERVDTIIGPHYYTGEGTAISDYSHSASWSHQHTLKRLLDMGVYSRGVADTIAALGVSVNNIDSILGKDTVEKRLSDWRKKNSDRKLETNPKFLRRFELATDDPFMLDALERYNRSIVDLGDEFGDPLTITKSITDDSSAFSDKMMERKIIDQVAKINKVLGGPTSVNELNLTDVVCLVRFILGYTNNNGLGMQSITYNEFINATEQMVENLEEKGHLIVGGRYTRTMKEDRISICLLPKGLNAKLLATPKYESTYHGDIERLTNEQYEMLKNDTVAEIKREEDPGKRNALFKMCDAVCYMNGKEYVSGHIIDNVYMYDLIQSVKHFGSMVEGWDSDLLANYEENIRLSEEYLEKLKNNARSRRQSRVDIENSGDYKIVVKGNDRTVVTYILRSLEAARMSMGLSYSMMLPANLLERGVNQAELSLAMRLGQSGIGPYKAPPINRDVRNESVKSERFKKLWSALREAELLGLDRQFITELRNTQDIDKAIEAVFNTQGFMERFNNRFMNVMSGKDAMIDGQMKNFIDRFWQRSAKEAPWWHQVMPGDTMTIFERRLLNDPEGLIVDIFNGNSVGKSADVILARQCMNWAKRGDMAQRNLVSAIFAEIASRSPAASFAMTTLITPYFQYATNRMGRILQWIAPISSLHYVVTQFLSTGPGGTLQFGNLNLGDLALEDVQLHASLKEAIWVDMCHLGPGLVAMMLVGLAGMASGILEPPEDDDKKGNFKEWTIFGLRVDENWWIEDTLGLALPLATFYASCANGEPRLDLITNGLSYYLSNNPVVKVSDAISVLFDPMAELYREYDKDLEGYARAMGGPPDIWSIASGKTTSFGLSYISQFITPGVLKEIYNHSQQWEKSYKRIYDIDETGQMTQEGRDDNRTQYTTYEDAVLRKFTKNNPVMGFLADMVMHPETGYMYHEMPNLVIYDPAQMNSMEVFSIYEDPYTKQIEKPYDQQLALGYQLISVLQGNSVDDLKRQGFMLDYDTKQMVSQLIWDMIAEENSQWADLEQAGALNYYTAGEGDYDRGMRLVSEMKETHYNYINNLKSLYYDKLWSDDLKSMVRYNQRRTKYAQDVNGEWYATGDYPGVWEPISIAPGETQGEYQYVMSRENDWQTESVITGEPIGTRGLVPIDAGNVSTPDIKSWSTDGSDTGHSELYNKIALGDINERTLSNKTTSGYPKSSGGSGYNRSYGGGGYYRRPSGGGGGYSRGGGSYSPNIYAPSVDISNPRASRIMNTDRIQKADLSYLRPDFETKGSREAYKRSDI